VILASAVPLAIASNVMRLTCTALAQEWIGREFSNHVHDWAGLLMPPFALLLLWGELVLLRKLFVESAVEIPFSMEDSFAAIPRTVAPRPGSATDGRPEGRPAELS
jgi:hypothetical protein